MAAVKDEAVVEALDTTAVVVPLFPHDPSSHPRNPAPVLPPEEVLAELVTLASILPQLRQLARINGDIHRMLVDWEHVKRLDPTILRILGGPPPRPGGERPKHAS